MTYKPSKSFLFSPEILHLVLGKLIRSEVIRLYFDRKQLCSKIISLEKNVFGEIHSSLCVRFYVCDAVVYDLQELECPLNPKNTYYIRKKLCKHTLSPQPTINIVKCLQLMLCCCIFLPSLSISVCCHKKNKI